MVEVLSYDPANEDDLEDFEVGIHIIFAPFHYCFFYFRLDSQLRMLVRLMVQAFLVQKQDRMHNL